MAQEKKTQTATGDAHHTSSPVFVRQDTLIMEKQAALEKSKVVISWLRLSYDLFAAVEIPFIYLSLVNAVIP